MDNIIDKFLTMLFAIFIMAFQAVRFALYMVMSFLHPFVTGILNLASGFSLLGAILVYVIVPSGEERKMLVFWMMLGTSFGCFVVRFAYDWLMLRLSPMDEYVIY